MAKSKLPEHAHGSPTKDFFINMITRDISVEDCLLDLLDNAIDGARRNPRKGDAGPLAGYRADVLASKSSIEVVDNCGGITLHDAVDYAFHFGRRRDARADAKFGIGLYGIGMKRAIFKLGTLARVQSRPSSEPFEVVIDVSKWLSQRDDDWDFDIEGIGTQSSKGFNHHGTRVLIEKVHASVGAEAESEAFRNRLRYMIARDYMFILRYGMQISVNGSPVKPLDVSLRHSSHFAPMNVNWTDEESGVDVELTAGFGEMPTDDVGPVSAATADPWGWWVVCNDRVVIAADKTHRTAWEQDAPSWHPQYRGILGIVHLRHEDAKRLPWGTTKRQIDVSDPLYRRIQARMRDATRPLLDYTNQRKANIEAAKKAESKSSPKPIADVRARASAKLPTLPSASAEPVGNVNYSRRVKDLKRAAIALGDLSMSYREVGVKTFEYFMRNEVAE